MTNQRRDFLKKVSLFTAGGLVGTHLLHAGTDWFQSNKKVGLQLYSLRDSMKDKASSTLEAVAKIGYKTLEAANYNDGLIYGLTPAAFKKEVNDLGMKMTSAHVGGPRYTKETHDEAMDWWKKAVQDHAEVGAGFLIKPSMPIPTKLDELKLWCDYYNSIGELSTKSGLVFGFHNHSREFEKVEGEIMYDYMLNNTDPQYFCMELDVYWVQQGGYKAVDYLKKYPGRFPLLHIKDEKELGESGTMDYQPIFEAAYAQGLKDYYVEVEKYNFEPIESVKQSFNYLAEASFVK